MIYGDDGQPGLWVAFFLIILVGAGIFAFAWYH